MIDSPVILLGILMCQLVSLVFQRDYVKVIYDCFCSFLRFLFMLVTNFFLIDVICFDDAMEIKWKLLSQPFPQIFLKELIKCCNTNS